MTTDALLTLKVLTPEGLLLKAERLRSIRVPLADVGTIGIRPMHAPLIAETIAGKVFYLTESERCDIKLHPGVLDIHQNVVTILTPGKIGEAEPSIINNNEIEYNRLMQALMDHLYPEEKQVRW